MCRISKAVYLFLVGKGGIKKAPLISSISFQSYPDTYVNFQEFKKLGASWLKNCKDEALIWMV